MFHYSLFQSRTFPLPLVTAFLISTSIRIQEPWRVSQCLVHLYRVLCWHMFLERGDRLSPFSSPRILLLIQAFHQKREPCSFTILVEAFLFSASSRWNACGKVTWAQWNGTSPLGWEGDCLREEHQRLMAWWYFQPCNEWICSIVFLY